MGVINVLTPQMANLIAAGEVVERPGSVVKEIIENSIDAGSRRIEVEIKNGGVTYIRVSDDGCGIERDDVEKAFLRHATSKIKEPSDIGRISTMGFRGEALAAIASVSKIDLFTRTALSIDGIHMSVEGGAHSQPEETGCPRGTTIIIRDLFYNVPARMKFLKKDATEGAYCENAVASAALAHPDIAFTLIKDGRESFFSAGNGSMLQVINALCGKETARELVPVSGSFPDVEIKGYVSTVSMTRSSRSMQYFLVNGRPVRGKILSAAVDSAYKGRIMPGRFPVVFLSIDLPFTAVDVNVHPAKLEVKFAREKEVFSAIHNTITMALEADEGFPELKLPQKPAESSREDGLTGFQQEIDLVRTGSGEIVMPESPAAASGGFSSAGVEYAGAEPGKKKEPEPDFDESMFGINKIELMPPQRVSWDAPARKASEPGYYYDMPSESLSRTEAAPKTEDAPAQAAAGHEISAAAESSPETVPDERTAGMKVIGQLFDTYIIVQQGDGMWLIDKHAAHERIIYNRLILRDGDQDMQTLLVPVTAALTPAEKQACMDNLPLIEKSGFEIEDYGPAGVAVRRAPTYLDESDIPYVLSDMAEKLMGDTKPGSVMLDELLKSISCKAAIKGGSLSDRTELEVLAREVLTRPDVRNCPHGRPVAVYMTKYELEKQFKRVL